MDAAQMLTAQEIARQCQELARVVGRHEACPEPGRGRHLRLAEPSTEPIPRVRTPTAPAADPSTSDDSPVRRSPDRELSERELGVLAFERQWWKSSGGKDRAIRELFDMSSTRYYQVLDDLLDDPAAARVDPMLIKRLRKVRASRQRARQARRLGIEWH